jgi:hypothetical protein
MGYCTVCVVSAFLLTVIKAMNKTYKPPKNPQKDRSNILLAEVEKRRSEISLRWGEERFTDLIDPQLRERYIEMCNKFNAVKASTKYVSIQTMAEGMLRAYDKCEENIRQRGHDELNGEIWAFTYEGIRFLVVKDKAYMPRALAMSKKEGCTDSMWHIKELLKLIPKDSFVFTDAIKSNFPGAEVIEPTTEEDVKNVGPITPFLG